MTAHLRSEPHGLRGYLRLLAETIRIWRRGRRQVIFRPVVIDPLLSSSAPPRDAKLNGTDRSGGEQ